MELKHGDCVQICYPSGYTENCCVDGFFEEPELVLWGVSTEGIYRAFPINKDWDILPIPEETFRQLSTEYLESTIAFLTKRLDNLKRRKESLEAGKEIFNAWEVGEKYERPQEN